MSSERESQIIEISLLKWISLITKQSLTTFQELTSGQFYISLLSSVKSFKLIKPLHLNQSQQSQSLADRISNMKIIGDSIVRFYQLEMMRDISQMKVNYVQLCMGNSSEAIKMFSFFIGIFVWIGHGQIYQRISQTLEMLTQQDQYIVKALIENTKNIGDPLSPNNDKSPISKKMLNTLEKYEDKIQQLQIEIQGLKHELEEQKGQRLSLENQIKTLKTQKSKLIQKSQVLEILNSRLEAQNSSFILQNQSLAKKIESQKRLYDQSLLKMQQKYSNYQRDCLLISDMKLKIQELKNVNLELKQDLDQKIQYLKGEEEKFEFMKTNYKQLQGNNIHMKERITELELQMQQLKYSYQYNPSSLKSRLPSPYVHNNLSQLSQVIYGKDSKLPSGLKTQLSQLNMQNSYFANLKHQNSQNHQESTQKRSSLGISNVNPNSLHEKCGHVISIYQSRQNPNNTDSNDQKVDFSKNICKVSSFDDEDSKSVFEGQDPDDLDLVQKNIDLTFCGNKKSSSELQDYYREQIQLLVTIVLQLQEQNNSLSKQHIQNKVLKSNKENRLSLFKKQLAKLRQMESIEHVNHNFQKMKENIYTLNSKNHFPLTFIDKKQTKKATLSERYLQKGNNEQKIQTFYPIIFN